MTNKQPEHHPYCEFKRNKCNKDCLCECLVLQDYDEWRSKQHSTIMTGDFTIEKWHNVTEIKSNIHICITKKDSVLSLFINGEKVL